MSKDMPMQADIELLRAAYVAFNTRNIDAALAVMSQAVLWPKAFLGGFAKGHDEVRAYWTEQWKEIDPHVEPTGFDRDENGRVLVHVHQVVRDRTGTVLLDVMVGHRFILENGLIHSMEVCELPSGCD
jgi:hypothetical protein